MILFLEKRNAEEKCMLQLDSRTLAFEYKNKTQPNLSPPSYTYVMYVSFRYDNEDTLTKIISLVLEFC